MRLVCSHCDRYTAAPLATIPPGWIGVTKWHQPTATVTHSGVCESCDEYRKTAFVVPKEVAAKHRDEQGILF